MSAWGVWKKRRSSRGRKVERRDIFRDFFLTEKKFGRRAEQVSESLRPRVGTCRTISETELQAELDIARPTVAVEKTERVVTAHGHPAVEDGVVEAVEVRAVEEVEELRAELEPGALGQPEVLVQREVNVGVARLPHQPAGECAERARRGEREGRRVEVLRPVARMQVDGLPRYEVGPVAACAVSVLHPEVIRVLPCVNVSRDAAEVGDDGVELPAAERAVGRATPLLERRRDVDRVGDERLPPVEVRVTAVEAVIERVGRGAGERSQRDV